jgi:hypothetical protein
MSDYNPEELNTQAEEVRTGDFDQTAEITGIEKEIAEEIFGEDIRGDPTKEMLVVTAETDSGTDVEEIFSTPSGPMSWRNPNFKLGNFQEEYGQVPEEGMTVRITVDSDGFLAIDY